ncbi:HU family DNA-binding protein [Bacteroides sp. 519]|uniref:HU family DNA-binding protein n=1 Tax=Bacteroides sp. 519 TaxID=2302937 RepID=UPI0013D72EF8|nr:HU family DNA-binding protein [Bacteroides sp. 519]NDV59751.1 DNA-binding protein [Bacteroides sp. 519]
MPVLYVARKKTFSIKGILKSLYFIVPKALQKKGVSENELADSLAELSSLSPGDVLSVLRLLPAQIAKEIKNGRTVTIDGLGTFYIAVSSDGAETPEECKPKNIRSYRVCFRADDTMKNHMLNCKFERIPDNDTENK